MIPEISTDVMDYVVIVWSDGNGRFNSRDGRVSRASKDRGVV
jgi:hypothetical protein